MSAAPAMAGYLLVAGGVPMAPDAPDPSNPWLNTRAVRGDDYDATYRARERAGQNVHGEADFVESYHPKNVLDAGCGTGRVAIELARRGLAVVGVDLDPRMLGTARKKASHLSWHLGDLAAIRLQRRFDAIVMAGNVMIFLAPGTEGAVLQNMARHLASGGVLIAGFQLSIGYLALDEYDRLAEAAGLVLAERYTTWDRAPWTWASTYAVSVHRHRPHSAGASAE
jgi:SAM-dependent methyltransferase